MGDRSKVSIGGGWLPSGWCRRLRQDDSLGWFGVCFIGLSALDQV
jgi:hypothetical protein